jgi:hypothetical protein
VSEYVSIYYPTLLHPYHRARTFFCPPPHGRYPVSVLTFTTTLSPMFPSPQRTLPEGLSKRDRKVLQKIKSRAHYLDKGMNLCGLRVGWTFWIVSLASFQNDSIYICSPQADISPTFTSIQTRSQKKNLYVVLGNHPRRRRRRQRDPQLPPRHPSSQTGRDPRLALAPDVAQQCRLRRGRSRSFGRGSGCGCL